MAKGSKKPQMDDTAEVPISSMIDVVFLLIIFFVVTAAIDKDIEDEKVILAEAPNGRIVEKKDPRTIVINVRQDGTIWMGMHQVTEKEVSSALERVKTQEAAKGNSADSIPILIRGDHHAQHGHISKAMNAITETGLYKVKLNAMFSK